MKLAIDGGDPVRTKSIAFKGIIGAAERKNISDVLDRELLSCVAGGPMVTAFEKRFAEYNRARYAITTTSGTTALHTALMSLDIPDGKEVITTPLTFVSTASVILQERLTPVFVDIDPDTFCIDPRKIDAAINEDTYAILPVHIYGCPANMPSIKNIAGNIPIIEDCAQAPGARIDKDYVGTFGDLGCFSFFQTKNITSGEGGAVITNKNSLAERVGLKKRSGMPLGADSWYTYDTLGTNYAMTELQAAILLVQLERLDQLNAQRREHAEAYKLGLGGLGLNFQKEADDTYHVQHVFSFLLPAELAHKRSFIVKAIKAEGVLADVCYPYPLYNTKLFQDFYTKARLAKPICPVCENVTSRIVTLFTDPMFDSEYISDTCNAVRKVLSEV